LVADEGAVGLDDDVVGLTELDSHALLVPGVQLDSLVNDAHINGKFKKSTYLNLVDMRRVNLSKRLQFLNLTFAKVADTNSLGLAFLVQSLQSSPHGLSTLRTRARTVDEEQIHVTTLVNLVHTLDKRLVCLLLILAREQNLSGDEDVLAVNVGLLDGITNQLLIGVVLRTVNVAVTSFKSSQTRLFASRAMRLVDAETEGGNLDRRVRQREGGLEGELGRHGVCAGL
jgi:hypothetical protein